MEGGRVAVEREGGIARVVLSHPGKLNAMSRAMWRTLRSTFEALQADAGCRCVIVQGQGGDFCAGGDIAEYPAFRFDPQALQAFHEEDVWGGLGAMLACDVPIVAAIEGACMGAGLEIACCCDLRVAAEDARFGAPIARLGFPMAPRELALVAGVAGADTTREMLLAAATFDGVEMRARGLVQRLAPAGAVLAQADALAAGIAALAPDAARANKQGLRRLARHNDASAFPPGLPGAAYAYADGAEHREGIAAFLEKRKPRF